MCVHSQAEPAPVPDARVVADQYVPVTARLDQFVLVAEPFAKARNACHDLLS